MVDLNKDGQQDSLNDVVDFAKSKAKDVAGDAAPKVKDFIDSATDKVKDLAGDKGEKVKNAAIGAADKAEGKAEKLLNKDLNNNGVIGD